MSVIRNMSSFLQEYIESVAEIIGYDMYVVDENLIRVAGTRTFKDFLGLALPKATSNGWVLQNKVTLCMFQPMEHEICQACPIKEGNICAGEYSIHVPIIIEKKVIGILTICTLGIESKKRIVKEKDKLIRYMDNVIHMIKDKITNEVKLSCYNQLLNSTEEAIIITDSEGDIIRTTSSISNFLKNVRNIYELIPGTTPKDSSYVFQGNSTVNINRVKVDLGEGNYNYIFFFKSEEIPQDSNGLSKYFSNDRYLNQIVGSSESIVELKKTLIYASKYQSNVLILGESGTGKGVFAKALHDLGDRRNEPFIPINCAAIPDNLIESELFGYEGGAFTGANKEGKIGKFEAANNGTIFLDEIGDMPISLQPKLLRAIETGKITRVGGNKQIQLDVRFIAATNKNLKEQIEKNLFRDDLYYRLCVIPINVLPLRDRREDIIQLAKYFIEKYNKKFSKTVKVLSDDAKKALLIYDWPGNVRELENAIEFAVIMEQTDKLNASSLPANICHNNFVSIKEEKMTLSKLRRKSIINLLNLYGNTVEGKQKAASELGISLSTLYRDIKKYSI